MRSSTPRPIRADLCPTQPARRLAAVAALGTALLLTIAAMASPQLAGAATPRVPLGTADSYGVLAGSTITNTGPTVVNGDLGLHPGTSVTGFGGAPNGTVNGTQHIADAAAQQAKADLVTAYLDASGRAMTAALPADIGGSTFTDGVYRTGGVPSLELTGNVTLDGQGNPDAVFIFQVASTFTTATDSSVTLINGAQSCNVYWRVGSSATIGTRTTLRGNVLAQTSISVSDAAVIDGRLLASDGAVTLINDTVTRATCAAATGGGDDGTGTGGGGGVVVDDTGGGTGTGTGTGGTGTGGGGTGEPQTDTRAPRIRITGRPPGMCTTRNFAARVLVGDASGIRRVNVFLDGRRIASSTRGVSFMVRVRGLRVGRHQLTAVAVDRAGNRAVARVAFRRCAFAVVAPRFTG